MEFNKINNFLGDSSDKVLRFVTKKWIEIHPQSTSDFNTRKQIKFKTSMLRFDLRDYSEAYVWVKGTVTANANGFNANAEQKFAFKNNAPFLSCISKINSKLVENAEDLDVVMPMYNLLEYSKNYEKTSRFLFNYYRDEVDDPNAHIGDGNQEIDISMRSSKSFDYKSSLNNKLPAAVNNIHTRNDVALAIPLKYLANLWRILNILLINCEVSLNLSWTNKSVLVNRYHRNEPNPQPNPPVNAIESPTDAKFKITSCKLYVPVVTLSTKNENKLFEMLKSGFKRTVRWNKYMSYISNQAKNSKLNY